MDAVWVVDDDQSIRWVLERALSKEGYAVRAYADAREAMAAFDAAVAPGGSPPQAVISDVRMPGESGVQMLSRMKARRPGLPVIVMTAFTDLDTAVQAFQSGAFEYLPKPFDVSQAIELIRRAVAEGKREAAVEEILTEAPDMLGQAPAMQEVFRAIGRLSQSNVTVMVTGESGTGKELVARALHRHSPRASKPFVALNTAAIPRDLLESELFGHERGAFTGAQAMRRGRFEQAEGGTLFLDEIGDMPAELQTRLLRVLSDGHFYRVGGHSPLKADVRVIAATHQNLESRVRQGLFREDLFHRLNVIRLRLPPLRERPEDVPLLARHFLAVSARSLGTDPKRLTDAAVASLARFSWPGNVRQLENVCNWLNVMAPAQTVDAGDLPAEIREGAVDPAGPGAATPAFPAPGAAVPGAGAAHDGDSAATGGGYGVPAPARREPLEGVAAGGWGASGLPGGSAPVAMPDVHADARIPARTGGWGGVAAQDAAGPGATMPPGGPTIASAFDRTAGGTERDAGWGGPGGSAAFPVGSARFDGFGHVRPGLPAGGSVAGAGTYGSPAAVVSPGEGGAPDGERAEWVRLLERDVAAMLALQSAAGEPPEESDLMDRFVRDFETTLLRTALRHTRGRRIEAAQRLGIGRNTITRKIKDLGLED